MRRRTVSSLNRVAKRVYARMSNHTPYTRRVASDQKSYEIVSDILRDIYSMNARVVRLNQYLESDRVNELTDSIMDLADKFRDIMDEVRSGKIKEKEGEEEMAFGEEGGGEENLEEFGPESEEEFGLGEEEGGGEEEEGGKEKEEEGGGEEESFEDFLKSLE